MTAPTRTPLDARLRYWVTTRGCMVSKCGRPADALTSKGGFETYCQTHAAEVARPLAARGEPLLSIETGQEWTP